MNIEAPRGVLSRPPLAITRESIFNTIGEGIAGKSVLDLFAGSGSLGIESLSRGARSAHFVDSARRCVGIISRNLRNLGVEDVCQLARTDALTFTKDWAGEAFDFVFVDPPFLSDRAQQVLSALCTSAAAGAGTLVIIRSHWRQSLVMPPCFTILKRRKFGESVVHFLVKGEGRSLV
jgi:16S rRNA (guanine966-N2)-methyltransferase